MEENINNHTALALFAAAIITAVVAAVVMTAHASRLQAPGFQYIQDNDSPSLTVQPRSGHIVSPQPATSSSVQSAGLIGQVQ